METYPLSKEGLLALKRVGGHITIYSNPGSNFLYALAFDSATNTGAAAVIHNDYSHETGFYSHVSFDELQKITKSSNKILEHFNNAYNDYTDAINRQFDFELMSVLHPRDLSSNRNAVTYNTSLRPLSMKAIYEIAQTTSQGYSMPNVRIATVTDTTIGLTVTSPFHAIRVLLGHKEEGEPSEFSVYANSELFRLGGVAFKDHAKFAYVKTSEHKADHAYLWTEEKKLHNVFLFAFDNPDTKAPDIDGIVFDKFHQLDCDKGYHCGELQAPRTWLRKILRITEKEFASEMHTTIRLSGRKAELQLRSMYGDETNDVDFTIHKRGGHKNPYPSTSILINPKYLRQLLDVSTAGFSSNEAIAFFNFTKEQSQMRIMYINGMNFLAAMMPLPVSRY